MTGCPVEDFAGVSVVLVNLEREIVSGLTREVDETLSRSPAAEVVFVRLHSRGGLMFEAFALAALLWRHGEAGKLIAVHVTGLAAGAAALILPVAKHASIVPAGFVGIGRSHAITGDDPRAMEETAAMLRQLDGAAEQWLLRRWRWDRRQLASLLDDGRMFSASEAVSSGLVDMVCASARESIEAAGERDS